MRILIVDGQESERATLASELAARGDQVATAIDGEDALGKLDQGHFDLVIAGLKLATLDGMELLAQIKQ